MKKLGFTLIELPVVRKQGFTLIELLVTISIIGVLSSMVLVSLNKARFKAKDARIKSAISQARTLIEVYGMTTGDYTGLRCGNYGTIPPQNCKTLASSNIDKIANDICSQQGLCTAAPDWPYWGEGLAIHGDAYGYAVLARISDSNGNFGWTNWFCMDSSGNSGIYHGFVAPSTYSVGPGAANYDVCKSS